MNPVWLSLACLALMSPAFTAAVAQVTPAGVLPGAAAWYLPTRDSSGSVFVFELGTGDPVVLLHGGPGADFTYLLPVANGLESQFRFVFYDQRGSLRSRVVPDSIAMPKHVEDLEGLRESLGAQRIKLIAHSAGTLLAFAYLEAHPDRVANLVLVGALPHMNGRKYFDAEYAAWWRGLADSARSFARREAVTAELRRAGVDGPTLTPRQAAQAELIRQVGAESFLVERWRETLPMRVNPDAARRTRATTVFEYDYSRLLTQHLFPVTIINGEFDYTVSPRGSPLWKRLAEGAPRLRVVVIPRASHIVWRDDPEAFRNALHQSLQP